MQNKNWWEDHAEAVRVKFVMFGGTVGNTMMAKVIQHFITPDSVLIMSSNVDDYGRLFLWQYKNIEPVTQEEYYTFKRDNPHEIHYGLYAQEHFLKLTPFDKDSIENLFMRFQSFSLRAFADANVLHSLRKLELETNELKTDVLVYHAAKADNKADVTKEVVDCMMCLLDIMAKTGITMQEFISAFGEKLTINENSVWIRNTDGTYSRKK